MNALAILFALTVAGALLVVPRRWALLPLLIGSCYMTLGQGIQIGPFSFTVIRLLIANTEIGQGTNTVMPMIAAEVLGVEPSEVELAPVDTSIVPNSGPTVASRTVMVVGGLVSKAAARLRALVEERSGGTFADVYRADAAAHGATRIDQQYEPEVEVEFDEATHTGDAYPAFGWAWAVASCGRFPTMNSTASIWKPWRPPSRKISPRG